MKDTVRINFEFPKEEHPYLKMMCAKLNVSVKDFASTLIINAIEEYEDKWLLEEAEKVDAESTETVSFEEACKMAGWDV